MAKRWILLVAALGAALGGAWIWAGLTPPADGVIPRTVAQTSAVASPPADGAGPDGRAHAKYVGEAEGLESRYVVRGGTIRFDFNQAILSALDLGFVARGAVEELANGRRVSFAIETSSTLAVDATEGVFRGIIGGRVETKGALLLVKSGDRVVIGNLAIGMGKDGRYSVTSTLDEGKGEYVTFDMDSVMVDFLPATEELRIIGELSIAKLWAWELGMAEAAGAEVGTLLIDARTIPAEIDKRADLTDPYEGSTESSCLAGTRSMGPDVIIADLQSVRYYGAVGDIHGYAVGTHACNLGTERADWIQHLNRHPVIVQNMYRLKDDRFEQIGMSWVKHGFFAVSWSLCGPCNDETTGTQLGVGCSDPYSASLNGVQSNMSRRSDVNAHTGYFPYPWSAPPPDPVIGKRLQVHADDLNPDLNVGARYFVQGHYVTPGDAAAGNSNNNATYRPVVVIALAPDEYDVDPDPTRPTQRGQPAIRAWQDTDPDVVETNVQVPGEGLFIVAGKATDLGTAEWRYSYAVQNLNSDRSCGSFSVPLPEGANVTNIGFHDVFYHSGEIYDMTDWSAVVENDIITWSTDSYAENPYANALRFSTLYNFYFDANVDPYINTVTLGLFKPGNPTEVIAVNIGPKLDLIDCNQNEIHDACDVDCNAEGCEWPCGGSIDCNDNTVPDECEPDCNENGIADGCDIRDCDGALWCDDCNGNMVPDGCEPDCDGNGIPDDCVPPPDSDNDGVDDCNDLCPYTTPEASCVCPPYGECCWLEGTYCLPDYPPLLCRRHNGVPECWAAPCRQGCLLGDYDGDGDLDLWDFAQMQIGYSDMDGNPGQVYWLVFDYDDDQDVDLADYQTFQEMQSGP